MRGFYRKIGDTKFTFITHMKVKRPGENYIDDNLIDAFDVDFFKISWNGDQPIVYKKTKKEVEELISLRKFEEKKHTKIKKILEKREEKVLIELHKLLGNKKKEIDDEYNSRFSSIESATTDQELDAIPED